MCHTSIFYVIMYKKGSDFLSDRLIKAFKGFDGVTAAFSTRCGGVSEGAFASLNPGIFSGDSKENIEKNLSLICDELGVARESLIFNHQVHGADVTDVISAEMCTDIRDADCFVTAISGITLTCITADCVPILFFDPVKKVIATAHAGWRGTVAGSQKAAVAAMLGYGSKASDILVEIGPCISTAAYEVSEDVASQFDASTVDLSYEKPHIDLRRANAEMLISCGIKPTNIKISPLCTFEREDMFFSHRRTGLPRGTQTAFISLR